MCTYSYKEKVKDFLSSKEVLEVGFKDLFLESLGYDVITTKLVYIDEYPFLEVYCNTQFKTQKQTNWLTVKEGVMINLLGTTTYSNYWKMYSFFKKLKESVKIDASKKNQNNTKTKVDVPNVNKYASINKSKNSNTVDFDKYLVNPPNSNLVYWKKDMTLFSGISTSYYDNNQIKIRQIFKNGKKYSLHRSWHSNGQLKGEKNWINGKEDGLHRSWHSNGQLGYFGNWINGEKDGLRRMFNSNGELNWEENYKNRKKDGLHREWWYTGEKRNQVNWINGEKDGLERVWRKYELPIYNLKDGDSYSTLKWEINWINGKIEGSKWWYCNTLIWKERFYENDELVREICYSPYTNRKKINCADAWLSFCDGKKIRW